MCKNNNVETNVLDQGPVNFSWEPTSVGMSAKCEGRMNANELCNVNKLTSWGTMG